MEDREITGSTMCLIISIDSSQRFPSIVTSLIPATGNHWMCRENPISKRSPDQKTGAEYPKSAKNETK